jgi:Xaa-Pro dipeptidase
MTERGVDGLVLHTNVNVFYVSGFASSGLSGSLFETDDSAAVVLVSRHEPEHPILVMPAVYVPYFASRPTWIEDIRGYGGFNNAAPGTATDDGGVRPREQTLANFAPRDLLASPWGARAQGAYEPDFATAIGRAARDPGLFAGVVGFDDVRFQRLAPDGARTMDAFGLMRAVRAVKTPAEVALIEASLAINQEGIEEAVSQWDEGMTWHEFVHLYHRAVVDRGGFIRDSGPSVIDNARSGDPVIHFGSFGDFEIRRGTNVMIDFHGTANHYCWDGGKTWAVGGEQEAGARRIHTECLDVLEWLKSSMVPGAKLGGLQLEALARLERAGVPGAESAWVFFHGMGLSHSEREGPPPPGGPQLEAGMVEAIHVLVPGAVGERCYLEDDVLVGEGGGRSLYTWSFEPLGTTG